MTRLAVLFPLLLVATVDAKAPSSSLPPAVQHRGEADPGRRSQSTAGWCLATEDGRDDSATTTLQESDEGWTSLTGQSRPSAVDWWTSSGPGEFDRWASLEVVPAELSFVASLFRRASQSAVGFVAAALSASAAGRGILPIAAVGGSARRYKHPRELISRRTSLVSVATLALLPCTAQGSKASCDSRCVRPSLLCARSNKLVLKYYR